MAKTKTTKSKMNRKDYDRWTTNGKDIVVIKTSKENKTSKKGK